MRAPLWITVSTFSFPTRHAHPRHGLLMARAFAQIPSLDALFLVLDIDSEAETENMVVRRIFGPFGRLIRRLRLRRLLTPLAILLRLLPRLLTKGGCRDVFLFTNDPNLIAGLALLSRVTKASFVFEAHGVLDDSRLSKIMRCRAIVCVTKGIADAFITRQPSLAQCILVAPNAVEVSLFDAAVDDREHLRSLLGISPNSFLIGYMGRFRPMGYDKGLSFMIRALHDLPLDASVLLVGGSGAEVKEYGQLAASESLSDRVHIIPFVRPEQLPVFAKSCDVLAYVPEQNGLFFETETSPMKLYEYMAARRPMVLSDLSALREIVSAEEAAFIPPGSKKEYVAAIARLREPSLARTMAERAYRRVARNTWRNRAEEIVSFARRN